MKAFRPCCFGCPICKNCDDYTQKLNGGLNQFKNQRYRIEICGTGPNDSGNHDPIRLRVFDTDGISHSISVAKTLSRPYTYATKLA